ncbi:MAG: type II toxin-antitoxin system prevent-host-death family antitoxin [Terriglobales bacterium]
MVTVTIGEAKTQLSRLIQKACAGEEIVITRGGRPVVQLVALPSASIASARGDRKPGAWKGRISYTPDVFDPLTDQELKDLGFE